MAKPAMYFLTDTPWKCDLDLDCPAGALVKGDALPSRSPCDGWLHRPNQDGEQAHALP